MIAPSMRADRTTMAAGLRRQARSASVRLVLLLGFWLVLSAPYASTWSELLAPADLIAGAAVAALATWASLRLWPLRPARRHRPSVRRLATLVAHLVVQAVKAGAEIAWWAIRPAPPLHPGVLRFRTATQAGAQRELFAAITSLVPGTVPIGVDDHGSVIVYHCLETRRPVALSLSHDEALLLAVAPEPPTVHPAGSTERGA